jgi:hypothetical protein
MRQKRAALKRIDSIWVPRYGGGSLNSTGTGEVVPDWAGAVGISRLGHAAMVGGSLPGLSVGFIDETPPSARLLIGDWCCGHK